MSNTIFGTDRDWTVVGRALDSFGEREQVMMAAGEIGEFLTHYGRVVQGRFDEDDFAGEVADVIVMMLSMSCISGPQKIRALVDEKLSKLEAKLNDLTPEK